MLRSACSLTRALGTQKFALFVIVYAKINILIGFWAFCAYKSEQSMFQTNYTKSSLTLSLFVFMQLLVLACYKKKYS